MEIAKSKLQISYDDNLEGLPFDKGLSFIKDELTKDVNQAFDNLKSSLTFYVRTLINGVPSAQEINVNIRLKAIPGGTITVTILGLENEIYFLLLDENGHPYLAKTDKYKKGET